MPSQADHVTAKILELTIAADDSAETFAITDIKFYFSRQKLVAADGWDVPFSGGAAAVICEAQLGSVVPPPSVIRVKGTVVA